MTVNGSAAAAAAAALGVEWKTSPVARQRSVSRKELDV